jgi:hypothetical protein
MRTRARADRVQALQAPTRAMKRRSPSRSACCSAVNVTSAPSHNTVYIWVTALREHTRDMRSVRARSASLVRSGTPPSSSRPSVASIALVGLPRRRVG